MRVYLRLEAYTELYRNVTHAHMQLDDGVYAVRASGEIVCVAALCNRKGIRDAIEKGFRVV